MPDTFFANPTPGSSYGDDKGQTGKHYWEHGDYHPMTEKPWKPIATKKPFINISYRDSIAQTLEKFGYRTFLKYTDYPEYLTGPENWQLSDHWSVARRHVDITRKRICSFLENLHENCQSIQEDIDWNYYHHKNVVAQEWALLYQHCPPLKKVDKLQILRCFALTVPNPHLHDRTWHAWTYNWLNGWRDN